MSSTIVKMAVCSAVAIILIGSILMPIINDAIDDSSSSETSPAEGAYGPSVGYYTIESTPTATITFFSAAFDWDSEVADSAITVTIKVNSVQAYNGPLSDLPKMILYADNNVTIYIDGETVYYSGDVNGSYSIRTDAAPTIQIYWRQGSYKTTIGNDVFNQTYGDITYYYAAFATDGEYSNFLGDTAPSMDTPAVAAGGMYIGPKMVTIAGDSPYAGIYLAIPVILLAGLMISVVATFRHRD